VILIAPHLLASLLGVFTSKAYLLVSGHEIFGPGARNQLAFTGVAAFYLLQAYGFCRVKNYLGYIAGHLVKCLDCGLKYYADPTNFELRDQFAASIERTAVKYAVTFKRSSGYSRLIASHLRQVARGCRNDILRLVPALATADCDGIAVINRDLARLIIRSQLGYWHQTSDIAKHGVVVPRRESLRISILTFIKDRSIQVALIALTAGIVAAFIGPILTALLRH
jgi:hypothetical protein